MTEGQDESEPRVIALCVNSTPERAIIDKIPVQSNVTLANLVQ